MVSIYSTLGGEILAESAPITVSESLLPDLLAKIQEPDHPVLPDIPTDKPTNHSPNVPKPISRFIPSDINALPWKGFTSSIKEYKLPISDDQYTAKLYKIAAGKELPEHTHMGNEYTYVMSGSFSDKAGCYGQGDFILTDTTTIHQPKAAKEADCICFAVLDAPLKMTGLFTRMLNPFLN